MDFPVLLPVQQNLLSNPFNQRHLLLIQGSLQLATWRVSGDVTLQKVFQRKLLISLQQDGVREQIRHTNLPGENGIAGVLKGRLIPFRVISDCS